MWTAPDIPKAPQLVLGRYRLLVKLGQGGMGDVYLAGSEGLGGVGKLVVIKRLRNMEDPQHVAMFLNEARIAKQLSHPNIVQTYEIGREADSHLLIMEYLEGPTLWRLRRLAADRGGVPWPIGIEIVRSVLDGLQYAHELRSSDGRSLKIVHRDLSENVIITQEGDCKILDFGIAKAADSTVQTQAGFVKGKLHTMPPEQLRGLPVDRRTDVFAAGVLLWEGLSGQSLWGNLGNIAISTRLVQGDIPPLRELEPKVPDELRQICETALSPQPEGRFESALAMKTALMDYAGRHDLVVNRAQVAAFVGPLFSEERERIDQIIRAQLEQQTAMRFSGVSQVPGLTPVGMLGTPGNTPARVTPGRSGGLTPVGPAPSMTVKRGALVGSAVVAAAAGIWFWQGRTRPPEPPPVVTPVRTAADEAAAKYLTAAEQSLASKNFEYGRTMLAKARAAGATDAEVNIRIERVNDGLVMAALLADARAYLQSQRWRAASEAAKRAYDRQPSSAEALELLNRARAAQQQADSSARARPKSRETGRSKKVAAETVAGRTPAPADPPPRDPELAASEATANPAPRVDPAPMKPDASPMVPKAALARATPPPVQRPHGGAVFSPAPSKVAPPSLPRVYVADDADQLRRICGRVEAAVVSLAGITPEYARGITGRFQGQVGAGTEIYPVAMYYFIVREAGLKHDNATAAAALANAQRTKAILVLKDLAAIDTSR